MAVQFFLRAGHGPSCHASFACASGRGHTYLRRETATAKGSHSERLQDFCRRQSLQLGQAEPESPAATAKHLFLTLFGVNLKIRTTGRRAAEPRRKPPNVAVGPSSLFSRGVINPLCLPSSDSHCVLNNAFESKLTSSGPADPTAASDEKRSQIRAWLVQADLEKVPTIGSSARKTFSPVTSVEKDGSSDQSDQVCEPSEPFRLNATRHYLFTR